MKVNIEQRDDGLVLRFDQSIRDGRALAAVLGERWLMEATAFANLVAIAAGAGDKIEMATDGGWLVEPRTPMAVSNGTATISVQGPIFPKANLFTQISGATSLSAIEREVEAALNDPSVERVLLAIDSPGGVATGISSLADRIYTARGTKPIVAVAQDLAASAALWLATAAGDFFASDTAMLGSIGVVMTAFKSATSDNEVQIVSSQSPKKRQDPSSESGRADLQKIVDSVAETFIGAVARNRGVSVDDVMKNFGQGGMLDARTAVRVGLVDKLGSVQQQLAAGVGHATSMITAADEPRLEQYLTAEDHEAHARALARRR